MNPEKRRQKTLKKLRALAEIGKTVDQKVDSALTEAKDNLLKLAEANTELAFSIMEEKTLRAEREMALDKLTFDYAVLEMKVLALTQENTMFRDREAAFDANPAIKDLRKRLQSKTEEVNRAQKSEHIARSEAKDARRAAHWAEHEARYTSFSLLSNVKRLLTLLNNPNRLDIDLSLCTEIAKTLLGLPVAQLVGEPTKGFLSFDDTVNLLGKYNGHHFMNRDGIISSVKMFLAEDRHQYTVTGRLPTNPTMISVLPRDANGTPVEEETP